VCLSRKDLDREHVGANFKVFFKTCHWPHLEIHPPMLVVSFFFGTWKGERNFSNPEFHHMEPWFSTGIRTCGQGFEGLLGVFSIKNADLDRPKVKLRNGVPWLGILVLPKGLSVPKL